MLVLSRKVGESIVIGSEVTITVLEVRGDHARIGIQAPRSVSVHRQEVHDELVWDTLVKSLRPRRTTHHLLVPQVHHNHLHSQKAEYANMHQMKTGLDPSE